MTKTNAAGPHNPGPSCQACGRAPGIRRGPRAKPAILPENAGAAHARLMGQILYSASFFATPTFFNRR